MREMEQRKDALIFSIAEILMNIKTINFTNFFNISLEYIGECTNRVNNL